MFLRYEAVYEVKGEGHAPGGPPGQCQWKGLITRNKNIYGLGVAI